MVENETIPNTAELNIEDYISAINFLAESKSDFLFNNSKPDLAAIVMAAIINHSDDEIRIYDHSLNGDISSKHSSLLESIIHSLERGKKIKLALQKEIKCKSEICNKLTEYMQEYPKGLDIRIVNETFRNNIKAVVGKDIYFTVGDNDAYRMETTEDSTNSRRGICSFNGPDISKKLIKAFDKEFKHCPKYNPATFIVSI
ncbi:MAG TPA: hypothetical protein VIM79_00355 [Niastella sp.]